MLWEQPVWNQQALNDCSIDQGLSEGLLIHSPNVKGSLVPEDALESANNENEEEPVLEFTIDRSYSIQDEETPSWLQELWMQQIGRRSMGTMKNAIDDDDIIGTKTLEVPRIRVQNLTVELNAVGTRVVRFEDGILVRVEN